MKIAFLVVIGLLAAGCTAPIDAGETQSIEPVEEPAPIDPLVSGSESVAFVDYDFGTKAMGPPDKPDVHYDVKIHGRTWYPEGDGPWPVIIFLHGQHGTCGLAGQDTFIVGGICEDHEVLESYRNDIGYAYLAEELASHGYMVWSALADSINNRNGQGDVGMWARGELMLATLDVMQEINDGVKGPEMWHGNIDLSRVGLMGHSRGGEGVVRALEANQLRDKPHHIQGVVALAPTNFNDLRAETGSLLTILPYCDGDVSNLWGAEIHDDSRGLVDTYQLLALGANHNAYNTKWNDDGNVPPGSNDAGFNALDRECMTPDDAGGQKISSAEQRQHALVYINGFLRWKVGPEPGLGHLFDAAAKIPENACLEGPCDRLYVSADETSVLRYEGELLGSYNKDGEIEAGACHAPSCRPTSRGNATQLEVKWDGDATLSIPVHGNWSNHENLAFRAVAIIDDDYPELGPITIKIVGPEGETTHMIPDGSILAPPGDSIMLAGGNWVYAKLNVLNQVAIPLDGVGEVTEVQFHFSESGRLRLADLVVT